MSWGSGKQKVSVRRAKNPADMAFERVVIYLPKKTVQILQEKSFNERTPVSRLCAIAVDNEMDQNEKAFSYPLKTPDHPYEEYQYVNEAGKILRFLNRFPSGTGIDSLMLCRRDIGIESREVFMLALRELFEKQMVEEFIKPSKYYGDKNYRQVRVKRE